MIRTDKHRKKEKTEDDEQQQEAPEKTNPNMRQRNTGKGSTYRIRTKVLWIRLIHEVFECADLRCGRRFVEKSGALAPSRTHWWGRKSCARKQHSMANEPWRRPTSLSLSVSLCLSLAKPLFFFYTFISSFQSPRSRCVHVSRFCGWNSLWGGKRGHSEERLLSWVQRGYYFFSSWTVEIRTSLHDRVVRWGDY